MDNEGNGRVSSGDLPPQPVVTQQDLVGTAEAAAILGVERPRIARWRKRGLMPDTVVRLQATPVWEREHVEALRSWVDAHRRNRVS